MKTNKSLVKAVILLSIFASSAFAALRPPYPSKASPPDHIIIMAHLRIDKAPYDAIPNDGGVVMPKGNKTL
jgi:hypothetical protein